MLTYCLQPERPAPAVGTRCSRVSADTYWCGTGLQNLREYAIEQTPTSTPTPTSTFTPTSTPTPIPTSTPTATASPLPPALTPPPTNTNVPPTATRTAAPPRVRPGGGGGFNWQALMRLFRRALKTHLFQLPQEATSTPFQPLKPTASLTKVESGNPLDFYGVDFGKLNKRVYIYLYPQNARQTKPIDYPLEEALAYAASLNTSLGVLIQGKAPLLIFETCGWRLPGEPWVRGVTATSASIYLGLIQKAP